MRDDRLRDLLTDVVARAPCDAILFSGGLDSGGLDTSIVASLARAQRPLAVTVVVDEHALDLAFVRFLATTLGLEVRSPFLDPAVIDHAVACTGAEMVLAGATWDTGRMTAIGATGPSPAQRQRLKHAFALLLPATLFGFLVAAQWQGQQERSSLAVRYNAPLIDAAYALQNEQNTLKGQLQELRKRLDDIQASAATQSGASSEQESRILDLKAKAGLTALTGDGVAITLDDARASSANAKDLDKSICHSTDLTDIINTAWRGGATAISVNDQRVVSSTSVYCVGSTIMVNGTLMSPPFTVLALGGQNQLLGAFDDPSQLRDIKQRRDVQGLGFRVTRASAIHIPAYDGALTVRNAVAR